MSMVENPVEKSPVSILGSLVSGFELAADKFVLLLIPLFLDILLWMSPRLDYNPLISDMIDQYSDLGTLVQLSENEDSIALINEYQAILEDIEGEFPLVHLPAFGIPSMLAGATAGETPFQISPPTIKVESSRDMLVVFLSSAVISLLITTIYLSLIGNKVNQEKSHAGELLKTMPGKALQLTGFLALTALAVILIFAPFFLLSSLFSAAGGLFVLIGLAILTLGGVILTWILIGLVFTPHGLFLHKKTIYQAMLDSLRLVQWRSFSAMMIILIVFLVNWAFNRFIWPLAGNDQVLILAAIIGHAFITTGSIIGTFVFFKDQYSEWEKFKNDLSKKMQSLAS